MKKRVYPKSVVHGKPVLGDTPTGWSRVAFGDILQIVERPIKLDATTEYQLVTVKRSRGGIVARERLRGDQIKTPTQYLVKTDDFLMSNRQIVHGACAIVPRMLDGAIVSNEYSVLHPKVGLDLAYLGYLSHTAHFQKTCFHSSIGVHVEKMVFKVEEWLNQQIDIPPFSDQQKIVEILSVWDRAIDTLSRQISAKELRRRALTQQLLTGQRRFPGFVRTNKERQTRWGRYPLDWEYPQTGDIAKPISVRNTSGNGLPVLSCTKHKGLVESLTYFGKQVFSQDVSAYKVVKRGQFAYATNHIEEGSIGYQDLFDEALISPMYTVFEADKRVNDRFLYLVLKTERYRHIFQASTSASVDRRGSLRWNEFRKIHVPLPSQGEQDVIVKVFETADHEIMLLEQELMSLREQKKGLLQQLLTGKRRVNMSAAA